MSFAIKALRSASGTHVQWHDIVHMASDANGHLTTTVFVSNLHCSSCVQTIEETLKALTPPPNAVQTSIVSQSVTIQHPPELEYHAIKAAIEDAGFDIATGPPAGPSRPTPLPRSSSFPSGRKQRHIDQCEFCQHDLVDRVNVGAAASSPAHPRAHSEKDEGLITNSSPANEPSYRLTLSVGGMTCASCTSTITQVLGDVPGVREVTVSLLGNSATATLDRKDLADKVVETVEDIGYEADIVSVVALHVDPVPQPEPIGPYLVSLSIGGMTCASCTSTITRLLSELTDVSDIAINLLGKSGSVTVRREDQVDAVVDTIESAGYEATVMSVRPIKAKGDNTREVANKLRAVSLRVDGMFCQHCPQSVLASLGRLGSEISVEKDLTLQDPIVRLTYQPAPPSFTIRTIVEAITSSNAAFNVSIYTPPSLEDRAQVMQVREKLSLLYRLVFAVIVAIPTFIIGVVFMSLVRKGNASKDYLMQPMWSGNASRIQWALFFLATPVMFYSAGSFHRRSLKELKAFWRRGSRTPVWKRFIRFGSMNLLVSSGVSVAYFSSMVLLALAASQPPSPTGNGDTTTYFDSVVFLTMFLLIGRYLEAYSKGRTTDAISSLGKLRPSEAYLLVPRTGGDDASTFRQSNKDIEKGDIKSEMEHDVKAGFKMEKIPVDFLEVGDVVRVQNGATPPADGTVVAGQTSFNESSLTGESRPISKAFGDQVFLGTINNSQAVDVKIDAIGGKTMLDHVVNVVRDGQTRRAPIERLADILTGYFVPVVTLLAICTWIIWLALGLSGALPRDYLDKDVGGWPVWSLEFAIAVFVVACPCGIGLAAPTALLVGSGLAANFGILARGGGEAFQEAAQLDAIVFDKTGTLTEGGEPMVTDFAGIDDEGTWTRDIVLGIAAEVESSSTHPLAVAIRRYAEAHSALPTTGTSFEETPGRGLTAYFAARRCTAIIGNEKWMEEHGAAVDADWGARLEAWKSEGKSVVLLAIRPDLDDPEKGSRFTVYATFAIADPLRPNAKEIISRLQAQGLATWMISGDHPTTATAVARIVGIPESQVIAGVLPHEKADKVRWLQEHGPKKQQPEWRKLLGRRLNERCIVAMVGDGINDAPALAAADVAVAIGSGSDVALSSASFILVASDLCSLLTLVDLSRTVFRRVKFNFLWAVMYNLAALPIAAGVIYPAGHARLDPVWGSLAMALSSVSVVCSSLMLRWYRAPKI
ncbi:heavy metal translocatin [Artomyces pyxidatus]|uniref:Heavy metal translocatin n=1 Tax=Artomyces pyxidatus TaxID=48021 RepID=A0ACB8TJX4_9AGAM|nr:heavy metal translocatin [Artomyces pyxidatus]